MFFIGRKKEHLKDFICKEGGLFPVVIWSEFRTRKYRDNGKAHFTLNGVDLGTQINIKAPYTEIVLLNGDFQNKFMRKKSETNQ